MNKTLQTGTTKTGVALLMLSVALAGGSTMNRASCRPHPKRARR
jgi:hypothetical protein